MEERSAADFIPTTTSLTKLEQAAKHCEGCDLYRHATQTVFGEGRKQSRLVFVGEQPGDQEDLSGQPFVGPAGRLLDEALSEAGINCRRKAGSREMPPVARITPRRH